MIGKLVDSLFEEGNEKYAVAKCCTGNFLFGFGVGAVSKGLNEPVIAAIPPGIDLVAGKISPYIIPYGLGVAMHYIPQIVNYVSTYLD